MSVGLTIIECMFDEVSRARPPPESITALEEFFERRHPSTMSESAGLIERIGAAARFENPAAAAQLVAVGELFAYRLSPIASRAVARTRTRTTSTSRCPVRCCTPSR